MKNVRKLLIILFLSCLTSSFSQNDQICEDVEDSKEKILIKLDELQCSLSTISKRFFWFRHCFDVKSETKKQIQRLDLLKDEANLLIDLFDEIAESNTQIDVYRFKEIAETIVKTSEHLKYNFRCLCTSYLWCNYFGFKASYWKIIKKICFLKECIKHIKVPCEDKPKPVYDETTYTLKVNFFIKDTNINPNEFQQGVTIVAINTETGDEFESNSGEFQLTDLPSGTYTIETSFADNLGISLKGSNEVKVSKDLANDQNVITFDLVYEFES